MAVSATTLLALTGTNVDANGVWFYVGDYEFPISVLVVGGGAGDGIQLNATNTYPLPANNVHDAALGSAITTDSVTVINGPITGLKARKSAATHSTTVTALLRPRRT